MNGEWKTTTAHTESLMPHCAVLCKRWNVYVALLSAVHIKTDTGCVWWNGHCEYDTLQARSTHTARISVWDVVLWTMSYSPIVYNAHIYQVLYILTDSIMARFEWNTRHTQEWRDVKKHGKNKRMILGRFVDTVVSNKNTWATNGNSSPVSEASNFRLSSRWSYDESGSAPLILSLKWPLVEIHLQMSTVCMLYASMLAQRTRLRSVCTPKLYASSKINLLLDPGIL